LAKPKIGLALSGGAARGIAHVGVLNVLEREGIPIDLIAGTSAGAIIGSLYARSKDSNLVKREIIELSERRITRLIDPALPRTGLIKGEKFNDLLISFLGGNIKFTDLLIPFACTATDIDTGELVVFDRGSVAEAIRASISLPGIFTVVKRQGKYLVDGGLANPVPVDLARRMGADFVIAVNVIPGVLDRGHDLEKESSRGAKEPNIINILLQSMHIGTYSLVRSSLEKADVVIEPDVAHIGAADLRLARECIERGELAAQDAMPEIRSRLRA
jgi:NTE family protein